MNTQANAKIEDLNLDIVKQAVESLQMPEKLIEKIELTRKDFDFIKRNAESTQIIPVYGIPVIVNESIKKSRIFYKTKLPFCMRCGVDKKKGYWEGGCSSWGIYYKRHVWNNSKKIQKLRENISQNNSK